MILNELFDNVARYTLNDHGIARFSIGGKPYTVDLYPGNEDGEIEVVFSLNQQLASGSIYQATGITGTGDELKVFATVVQILRDFAARSNPRMLSFGADLGEPSRVKLYDRMAKSLSRDWRVHTEVQAGLKVYKLFNPNYKPKDRPADNLQDVPF